MEKMIILPNKKNIEFYTQYNINKFILPLEEFSIGCDTYFNINEINELSSKYEIYVLMNKLLHRKIKEFDITKFNDNIKFIVEDIGLSEYIPQNRIIIYENHILSNYKAINFLNEIGYSNVVINNDLTIKELETIIEKTNSNIFYYYTSKNNLMYSRRKLVSNYNIYYNIDNDTNTYLLDEKVSHNVLKIMESDGSIVKYNKIFCASKYLDKLSTFNLIIDFSSIDELNEKIILENLDNKNLCNLIDSDYYFLENDIKFKVGDLK